MFEEMMNDTIDLVKADGGRIEGIKAVVQPAEIITLRTDLEAAQGDRIERTLESGEVEGYQVSESLVEAARGAIPAFCRIRVRKETAAGLGPGTSIVFGLGNSDTKVRLYSADSLTTIAHVTTFELFAHLRQAAESGLEDGDQKIRMLTAVDELRQSHGTPDFAYRVLDIAALAVARRDVFEPYLTSIGQLLAL